jgi:hypothetical protein
VEKSYPGVSTGAEEHKMDSRIVHATRRAGRCTCAHRNLIGEAGKGQKSLQYSEYRKNEAGRGAEASRTALRALQYSKQRIAFGKPISSFGAIQQAGEMAIRIWVTEAWSTARRT